MHRKMIEFVNGLLEMAGAPPTRGWDRLPGNAEVPIPRWSGMGEPLERVKSSWFWETLEREAEQLRDVNVLSQITLAELGTMIEFGVHNALHLRFGEHSDRFDSPSPAAPISTAYDRTSYNTLIDMYAAHVNPLFWALHGWIDDCIRLWQVANGGRVSDPVRWTHTWTGPMGHHMDGGHKPAMARSLSDLRVMESALAFLEETVPVGDEILPPRFARVLPGGGISFEREATKLTAP
jgi:hypothetical protein